MTTSTTDLLERLEQVVAQFNRGSLDLPEGFLDRSATFRLNGVTYEETLGRTPDDPLVRLIARGSGAYRFLAKALRYALPDAHLTVGQLEREADADGFVLRGPARLVGTLRGQSVEFDGNGWLDLRFDEDSRLVSLGIVVDEHLMSAVRTARAS